MTDTARCERCGADNVPVVERGGRRVLALHTQKGGEGHCYRGSWQPVDEQKEGGR